MLKSQSEDCHLSAWLGKALNSQFCSDVLPQVNHGIGYIQHVKFIKEPEGLIFAAQEQALATNVIKAKKKFQLDYSPLYHLCNSADETIDHLISYVLA